MSDPAVLRVGIATPVESLDPRTSLESTATVLQTQVFEPPAESAESPGWMPLFDGPLVQEHRASPVWIATVLPGRRFSDGTRVTPELIVKSLEGCATIDSLATMAVDGSTIRFTTPGPGRLQTALSQRGCSVVLEREGGELLGTGPFHVVERARDRIRLEANRFWAGYTTLEAIEIVCLPSDADGSHTALIRALERGEIDLTLALDRDEVNKVEGVKKLFQPGRSTAFLACNMDRPFFADVELRRAIAACIDRHALSALAFEMAGAFAAQGLLPRQLGTMQDSQAHDPAAARAAMDRAAATLPETLRLLNVWAPRPYLPRPGKIAAAIAAEVEQLGPQVEFIEPANPAEYMEHLVASDYDLALAGWMAEASEVADFLEAVLGSGAIPNELGGRADTCNVARWSDPELDAALGRLRGPAADEALLDIEDRLRDGAPVIPLMYGPEVVVHAWRVRNFEPGPLPFFAGIQLG